MPEMSSQPDTSPLPQDLAGLQTLIAQLRDDLNVQRTIYKSLAEFPFDPDIASGLTESESEIKRIQERLKEARRAEYQGITSHPFLPRRPTPLLTCYVPPQAQKSARPPSQNLQPRNHVNSRDFAAGKQPRAFSNHPGCIVETR